MMPDLVRSFADEALAVSTRGLCKSWGRERALDGLDLAVPEGAVYVLAGANGAGKTTTLRILLDLVQADRGEARVLGRSPARDGAQVRARLGYVPEDHRFGYLRMRVDTLLEHHASYFPSWDLRYAAHLVEALEISPERRFGALSRGQARRVQLVSALAHRPAVLLLDDPTEGLDPVIRDRVLALLAEHLASSPTTVLLATHVLPEVEGLVDCVGVLERGRLVAQLRYEEIRSHLLRVRSGLPRDGADMAELEGCTLARRVEGREIEWILWGERAELEGRLGNAGATIREVKPLSLNGAIRRLMQREV